MVVGGTQPGAINVIGASLGHGLAPDQVSNITMEGNYIGLGYDGTTVLGNVTGGSNGSGFSVSNMTNSTIKNNRVAGWKAGGIALNQNVTNVVVEDNIVHDNLTNGIGLSANAVTNISVTGNQIFANTGRGIATGSGATGVTIIANQAFNNDSGVEIGGNGTVARGNSIVNNPNGGLIIMLSSNNIIGGSSVADRNIISGNGGFGNILIYGAIPFGSAANNNVVQGNYIGTNDSGQYDSSITQGPGILIDGDANNNLIGGVNASAGNVIAGNTGGGVLVAEFEVPGVYTGTPSNNAILGNSIKQNVSGNVLSVSAAGLGVDLLHFILDPNTFLPSSSTNGGPTLNDASDSDSGPNKYMNFPVINSASQNGTALSVNFNLDNADSTDGNYRIEFFANDAANASGYGEGQTYLGSTLAANGNAQTANLTLANGTDLTGKVITATATAVNNTTSSGFGATSEFSQAHSIEVIATAKNTSTTLALTGENIWLLILATTSLLGTGVYLTLRQLHRRPVRIRSQRR